MPLIVLGVAGCLLCHEQQILNSESQRCGLPGASHLGQESVDAILREVDHALVKLLQHLQGNSQGGVAGEDRIAYTMILASQGQALAAPILPGARHPRG